MQNVFMLPLVLLLIGCPTSTADKSQANPLSGVIQMLGDLKAKVTKDGEDEAKAYNEYYDWCNKVTGEELHSIKLDEERKEKLIADIEKYFAEIEQSGQAISEEAKAIAQAIKDGKNALHLREKQHSEFMDAEKELVESIDMLSRAITVLEQEMKRGASAAAFTQILGSKLPQILQVLSTVLDAASFSASDKDKLVALLQSQQEDDDANAPSAAVYSSKSGSIVDMLNEMKDKAESKLEEIRQAEQQARFVYNQLVAALKAQKKADEKDMSNEKEDKNEATEDKADAEKDLSGTVKVLDVHTEAYRSTKAQCMQTASDHEQTVKSRSEELKVIGEATDILKKMTSKAAGRTYTLLQIASGLGALKTQDDLAALEVVTLIRKMARSHHSAALAQLGAKINAAARSGATEDVFAKIKGMIKDMISKLEKEQQDEASEKKYCDDQLADATQKESDMMDTIKTIASKKEQKASKSATAKEDEKQLLSDIANIDEAQAELDKVRKDEHAAFMEAKSDLELGIKGVRRASSLLKDYYSEEKEGSDAPEGSFMQVNQPATPETHSKSGSAIDGILEILEMTESDFATSLAKEQTEEADSQADYEKTTAENEVEKTALQQQAKFKVSEYKTLDTQITQHESDLDAAKTEHSAVMDFLGELKKRCKAKPSSYEIRQQKRQAEITGLKEAMEILKNEVAFAQRRKFANRLRGGAIA